MKLIKKVLLVFALFFSGMLVCNAATLNVNEYLSSSQVVVGNTVTVTVKLSSSNPIGAVNYSVSYDSSKLTHTSGTLNDITDDHYGQKSFSLIFKFKAKESGNATINFKVNEAYDTDLKALSFSNTSKTVKIITQSELQATYSSDSYLSKLGVEGQNITPAFNKNTLEYSLEVENNVEKINVTGSKNDSKASVNGLGEHTLEEGLNKIEIKVTAQNGSSRTYKINVTRKELAPINVEVEKVTYSVVRKASLLEAPNTTFTEATTNINNTDVPCLVNDKLKLTLVGLKDSEGNVTLYKYENNNYTKYIEITNEKLMVIPTDEDDELFSSNGLKKETFKINDTEFSGYTKGNGFYIFKGINVETGTKSIYQYDTHEKTIQLFNSVDLEDNNNQKAITERRILKRNILIVVLALVLAFTYFGILISLLKNKNKGKKKVKEKTKKEKIVENYDDVPLKTLDDYEEETTPDEYYDEYDKYDEYEEDQDEEVVEEKEGEKEPEPLNDEDDEDDEDDEIEQLKAELKGRRVRKNKKKKE